VVALECKGAVRSCRPRGTDHAHERRFSSVSEGVNVILVSPDVASSSLPLRPVDAHLSKLFWPLGAGRALREARRGSPILSIAFAASYAMRLSERSCRIADRGKNHFTFIKAGWNKPSATNRIYNAVRTGCIKIEEQRGSLVPY
jgi:hypothetical protein